MKPYLIFVTVCVVALAASGCVNRSTPTQSITSSGNGAASAPANAAADPCDGVAGCAEVATVDVDGDGAPDRVGMTISRETPPPQVVFGNATIGVLIASGATVHRIDVHSPGALPGTESQPTPYVGAYRISRGNGADLVFHTQLGHGNSEQFVVVGWSAANPTLVVRPPVLNANYPDPAVWYVMSSHGQHEWMTCADGAAITANKLSAPTEEGIPIPGGGIREVNHFTFDGTQWFPSGSDNIADNDFSYDFDPHTQTFQCEDQGTR